MANFRSRSCRAAACGGRLDRLSWHSGLHMTRRTHLALLTAAATSVGSPVFGKDNTVLQEILEASQKDKKGVNLYVKGQAVPGVVTKIDSEFVELRSREYSRIVVRLASIDAAALS